MSKLWSNILFTSDKGLFKIQNGETKRLFADDQPLYGLTWNKEAIFISCYKYIRKLSFDFKQLYKRQLDNYDYHQCLFANESFYVCNTRDNHVWETETDDLMRTVDRYVFEGSNKHLNSLFFEDGYFYACLHGNCRTESCKATEERHSTIVKLDDKFNIVKQWSKTGCGSHNVYVEDGKIYTLNSTFGSMTVIDAENDDRIVIDFNKIFKKEVFPRGIARNKEHFYIGLSEVAERDRRDKICSSIVALDNDLNYVGCYNIPEFHHIRDVRLCNQIDFAHNQIVLEV